jgi:hypothetical protein
VERNPEPPVEQITIHVGSITNMTHFMAKSIKKSREEFGVLDDAWDGWEDDTMSAFTELVVAQAPCAYPMFMRMMDLLETEYQDPVQLDMLRTYGPIMRHVVKILSTVMSMTPEQTLKHMLMSCVLQHLGPMHGGPPQGSTSRQVSHYGESNDQKLPDMIKLSRVAFSSQHQCSVTPEGLKEA